MSNTHSRRAFTLVDLLAATACVALAGAVLLPALAHTRNASQGDTSRSNLKVLMRSHTAYTIGHQDHWVNPFNPTTHYNGGGADPEWYSARVPGQPGLVWRFDDANIQTEMYSFHWASQNPAEFLGGNPLTPAQFDPRDNDIRTRALQIIASPGGPYIWASSYMYSPTMWFNPARYTSAVRLGPTNPVQLNGVRSVRYNTTAETLYPSQKAVLFQRADFDQSSRIAADGQPVPLAPQWNNARAVPDVAFADGSVDEVSIRKVQNAIDESVPTADWLRPTGPVWNVPSSVLTNYGLGDSWENGQNNTTAWQAFFWGTRNGVAGRDVPRR